MSLAKIVCCRIPFLNAVFNHQCACPVASIDDYNLKTYQVDLYGHEEFENPGIGIEKSTPRRTYTTLTKTGTGINQTIDTCISEQYVSSELESYGSSTCVIDINGNETPTGGVFSKSTTRTCTPSGPSDPSVIDPFDTIDPCDADLPATTDNLTSQFFYSGSSGAEVTSLLSIEVLENDIETYALGNPPLYENNNPFQDPDDINSYWQVRSNTCTLFRWWIQSCEYKITCTNLVVGFNYRVTPIIRRRTIEINQCFTDIDICATTSAFESVAVTPYEFTATSTEETIDDTGDYIDLPLIKGYEYQLLPPYIERI